jgi:hypothetical protein
MVCLWFELKRRNSASAAKCANGREKMSTGSKRCCGGERLRSRHRDAEDSNGGGGAGHRVRREVSSSRWPAIFWSPPKMQPFATSKSRQRCCRSPEPRSGSPSVQVVRGRHVSRSRARSRRAWNCDACRAQERAFSNRRGVGQTARDGADPVVGCDTHSAQGVVERRCGRRGLIIRPRRIEGIDTVDMTSDLPISESPSERKSKNSVVNVDSFEQSITRRPLVDSSRSHSTLRLASGWELC